VDLWDLLLGDAAGVSGAVFLQGSRFGSGLQARELKDLKAIGQ